MDASALLTDYYELTMANGYFCAGLASRTVCYDIFLEPILLALQVYII